MAQVADLPGYEGLRRAYADGRFLDGKELLDHWRPALETQTVAARLVVHRLLNQLGTTREAVRVLFRLWQDETAHPEVLYHVALSKFERRGLWHAFRWAETRKPGIPMNHPVYPAYTALRARLYSQFRDFRKAHELLARACRDAGDQPDPWLAVEAAHVWLAQDRPQDALAAARRAREMRPNYLPAILAEGDALLRLGEDQAALQVTQDHVTRLQSPHLAARLVELCIDQAQFEKASDALEIVELYGRHADAGFQQWLVSQRCLVAYQLGRFQECREYALRLVESPWHQDLAAKLANPNGAPRPVQLAVPYVPQHHLTCAPATLAAISRYWGRPVDQEAIAAAICYDGTPEYEERIWIEQHGFLAREFRADWPTARALIDAGIPFAVVSMFPRTSHLQAVIGYDPLRETLLIRDPSTRGLVEFVAERFFDEQRPYGPRGLALVPPELQSRLFALDLPETHAYEHLHRFDRALGRDDRQTAGSVLATLQQTCPDADVTLMAELRLAQYDLNWPVANERCQRLIERYPNALRWRVQQLVILRQLRDESKLRRALENLANRAHPEFWVELANFFLANETWAIEAKLLLLRALRY
ncbi:MAG: C39 family peptidase, partial [Verrucomicrobia bacterium]|nr:C39 family peptidase [Verrucomicrobiota bacterium]